MDIVEFRLLHNQRLFCIVTVLIAQVIGSALLGVGATEGGGWSGTVALLASGALLITSAIRVAAVMRSRLALTEHGVEITRWRKTTLAWGEIESVKEGMMWTSLSCISFVLADRSESAWVPVHDALMPDYAFSEKLLLIQQWHTRHKGHAQKGDTPQPGTPVLPPPEGWARTDGTEEKVRSRLRGLA